MLEYIKNQRTWIVRYTQINSLSLSFLSSPYILTLLFCLYDAAHSFCVSHKQSLFMGICMHYLLWRVSFLSSCSSFARPRSGTDLQNRYIYCHIV